MPIGSGDAYQVYRNRYEHIIEPAVNGVLIGGENAFRCIRADFVTESGSITRDVIGRLYRSDAVIADLTDLNPNVFYELGVRHSLRSGTILIALKGTKPPFDLGDLRVIPYEDRVGGEKQAIPEIQGMLKSLLSDVRQPDSPVLNAIPELAALGAAKELEARNASLTHERDLLKAQLEVLEKVSLTTQNTLEALRAAIEALTMRLSEPVRSNAQAEVESLVQAKIAAAESVSPSRVGDVIADRRNVFILIPFGREWEPVSEVIRSAVRESGFSPTYGDTRNYSYPLITQVYEEVKAATLIIAELTGSNPNVMYELGIADAMGIPTLLLSQNIEQVPADLRNKIIMLYKKSPDGLIQLKAQLIDSFRQHLKAKPENK